jgi:hypothetical protein
VLRSIDCSERGVLGVLRASGYLHRTRRAGALVKDICDMEYRTLVTSGLKVPVLCLGALIFGAG